MIEERFELVFAVFKALIEQQFPRDLLIQIDQLVSVAGLRMCTKIIEIVVRNSELH